MNRRTMYHSARDRRTPTDVAGVVFEMMKDIEATGWSDSRTMKTVTSVAVTGTSSGHINFIDGSTAKFTISNPVPFHGAKIKIHLEKGESTISRNTSIEKCRAPKTAELLLRFILPKDDRNAVIGDLDEEYQFIQTRFGSSIAIRWYCFQSARTIAIYAGRHLFKLAKFGLLLKAAHAVWLKLNF